MDQLAAVPAVPVDLVKFWCTRFRENNARDAEIASVWYNDIEKWHEVATPAGAILAMFSCSKLKGDKLADVNQEEVLQSMSEYRLIALCSVLSN
jgi:hypothetical protein